MVEQSTLEKFKQAQKMLKETKEETEEEREDFEPTWDFTEKGKEQLIGEISEVRVIDGPYGESRRYVINIMENGELKTYGFWGNTVINRRVKKLAIEEGDVVGVQYLGKKLSKNKREYLNFKVVKV